MSDLHWERRHHSRDDFRYSIADSTRSEVFTRHSRFSWWQMTVKSAAISIRDDLRPSLDASSSYSIESRPSTSYDMPKPIPHKLLTPKPTLRTIITHMRLDSSDGPVSPMEPSLDLDDWPTPPTSGISPSASINFPASHLPWKTPPSSVASGTPTTNVVTSKFAWQAKPTPSAEKALPPLETGKPDLPERSLARKSASSALLDEMDQVDELLKSRYIQLYSQLNAEVKALRHKSAFLEETLKQTVHQRLALHAERESISPGGSLLTVPVLDPKATIVDRGRPVSRTGYILSDGAFWDARAPSAFGMVSETEGLPNPTQNALPSNARAVKSTTDVRAMPSPSRKKPVLSIMPNLVTVPKTRLPIAPSPTGEPSLRRSISLPRGATAGRATSPTRAMSEAKALQTAQNLHDELTIANARDGAFNKIIDIWKSIGTRAV